MARARTPKPPDYPFPAALQRLADTIQQGQAADLTPLDDLNITIEDHEPYVYAETLDAYEWANHLRLRVSNFNVENGEVEFTGDVNSVHWVLRYVPETAAYVPTGWSGAIETAGAFQAVTS